MAKAIFCAVLSRGLAEVAAFSSAPLPSLQVAAVQPTRQVASTAARGARLIAEETVPVSAHSSAGALLVGAALVVTAAFLRSSRGSRNGSAVVRGPWEHKMWDRGPKQGVEGASPRGPSYRHWINLRKQSNKGQRYYRQQQILRDSGIESAKGGFTVWYPDRELHNLYKGPESHPDNPWFPACSPGYDKTEMGPPRHGYQTRSPYLTSDQAEGTSEPASSVAAVEASSVATEAFSSSRAQGVSALFSTGGILAAGRSVGFARAKTQTVVGRSRRFGVIMHAHKKAASSTKNQGRHQNPQYYGLFRKGKAGNAVKAGQMLLRQKGFKWHAGANVAVGKDYSFNSLKDGIVQWRGNYRHKEVFIVPWEYVREKCQWIRPNCLGPKEYEPWMGTIDHHKRDHILKLREEWLETDKGKEWASKKAEKEAKQKEIQKKIRAIRKAKRAGVREDTKKEVA